MFLRNFPYIYSMVIQFNAMRDKNEISEEVPQKKRVSIYVTTNRKERIAAIRRAYSHTNGKDYFTEDINDIIMEEGCRQLESRLGL